MYDMSLLMHDRSLLTCMRGLVLMCNMLWSEEEGGRYASVTRVLFVYRKVSFGI